MSRAAASARSVSTDTPSQTVPNLDHLVTQWMSTVTATRGNAWKSFQVHRTARPHAPRIVKSHASSETRGVGPAERTGKSRVSYCPGGNRAVLSAERGRPRNPRENMDVIRVSVVRFVYRNDLNAARSSDANSCGSSHAAKCPPRSTSL